MYQHCRNKVGMNGVVVWETLKWFRQVQGITDRENFEIFYPGFECSSNLQFN